MPGRSFSADGYRFGFNGKENDNEVKGVTGGQQDYGFRIYDPRLGKFLSVDPLTKQYPELTPYQFASNTPVQAIDLDGLEASYRQTKTYASNGDLLSISTTLVVNLKVINHSSKIMNDAETFNYVSKITDQIKTSFTSSKDQFSVEINATVVSSVSPKDFYVDIVDEVTNSTAANPVGPAIPGALGKIDNIGNTQTNRLQVMYMDPAKPTDMGSDGTSELGRTGAHELGHGLGLRHPFDEPGGDGDPSSTLSMKKDPNNLMRQSKYSGGTDINNQQRNSVIKQIDKDGGKKEINSIVPEKKIMPGQSVESPTIE